MRARERDGSAHARGLTRAPARDLQARLRHVEQLALGFDVCGVHFEFLALKSDHKMESIKLFYVATVCGVATTVRSHSPTTRSLARS